jgi:hypothetical protein
MLFLSLQCNLKSASLFSRRTCFQVGDKLGRSFYSSSMPANITQRGMFGGRAERDAASHGSLLGAASASSSAAAASHNASAAGAGRRRAVSDATAAGATATIFGFMSGGSHTDPSQLDALGRAGVLGAGGAGSLGSSSGFGSGLSQSLSAASPGHRGMGRFRDSIAEEAPAAFEDSDEEFGSAVRRGGHGSGKGRGSAGAGGAAKSGHPSSSKPRNDSIVDDLQFNLSLDPEEDD